MLFSNTYIKGRDKLVNGLLGIDLSLTMTPDIQDINPFPDATNLGAEIKKSINLFKAIGMDKDGKIVNYHRISQTPEYVTFRMLVSDLAVFDYKSIHSREGQIAFWINLYNALVIDAVIQEEVKNSVTESRLGILSFFQRAAYIIKGQRFSLTDIEHGVLRGNRGFPYFPGPHFSSNDPRIAAIVEPVDPRIHFALNCASNSCPPVGIFSGEMLDAQLNLASKNFVNNDLVLEKNKTAIKISQIFRWYQVDFNGREGILRFLINNLSNSTEKEWLTQNQGAIRINYHPYDWGLNQLIQ